MGSFALATSLGNKFPDAVFYHLPTRVWEFLSGAVLALAEARYGRRGTPTVARYAALIALGGLGFSISQFDARTTHPGWGTLVPVASAMLLIWYGGREGWVTAILTSRAAVGIGLISYSLYLWHQPIFAFARIYSIHTLSQASYVALIALAGMLSFVTWRWVEQPARHASKAAEKKVLFGICAAMCVLAGAGIIGHLGAGWPDRFPQVASLEQVKEGFTNLAGELCTRDDCIVGDKRRPPSVLMIGDSHAGMLAQSLDRLLADRGASARILANGDMFIDRYPDFYATGDRYNPVLETQKAKVFSPEIKTVILLARYTLRVENTPFDNQEGGVEVLPDRYRGRNPDEKLALLDAITRAIQDLQKRGKNVVIVYPVPEAGWDVPKTLRKLSMRGIGTPLTTSYETYRRRNERVIRAFDAVPDGPQTLRVFPDKVFCNTFIASRCATHWGSVVFYSDDDHLSVAGADLVSQEIILAVSGKWGLLN